MTLSPAVRLAGLPAPLRDALDALADASTPVEDRAALWASLYEMHRQIRRALGVGQKGHTVQQDLIEHMAREGIRDMGPLSVKWTPAGVAWPVNAEDNWGDLTIQEELEQYAKIAPDFIRHIPAHYEIRTAELGEAVHANDPVAQRLHAVCKERRWRTETHRNSSLVVKEARP